MKKMNPPRCDATLYSAPEGVNNLNVGDCREEADQRDEEPQVSQEFLPQTGHLVIKFGVYRSEGEGAPMAFSS